MPSQSVCFFPRDLSSCRFPAHAHILSRAFPQHAESNPAFPPSPSCASPLASIHRPPKAGMFSSHSLPSMPHARLCRSPRLHLCADLHDFSHVDIFFRAHKYLTAVLPRIFAPVCSLFAPPLTLNSLSAHPTGASLPSTPRTRNKRPHYQANGSAASPCADPIQTLLACLSSS